MSLLSDKYKIPEPTIKNMIADGVIPCSWIGYEDVFRLHKEGKSIADIAVECKIAYRTVHHILRKFR